MTVAYVVLLLAGGALLAIALPAARGRLPRNHLAGIRTARVMRSERSWRVGHEAAAPWLLAAGIVVAAGAAALLAVRPPEAVGGVCLLVLAGLMGALVAVATRVAGRAAGTVN